MVSVLCGVRDGPVLLGDAAFVHQVNDEFYFVRAVFSKIRHLRLEANVRQSLEAVLDEGGDDCIGELWTARQFTR